MPEHSFKYVIVGGGLAGASAVEGIREMDSQGSILLIGNEMILPYHRPPLTKDLWLGKKKLEEIFVNHEKFYKEKDIHLILGCRCIAIDGQQKTITVDKGTTYGFEKLLIATGGLPRSLSIPGGDLSGIYYFRSLDDYMRLRPEAGERKSAVVIGGGFIGSEIAAALTVNKVNVTLIFPSGYLCSRVLPDSLGTAMQLIFHERGVKILSGQRPMALTREGGRFVTRTDKGQKIESDLLIIGVGIKPEMRLARDAGLKTGDGIIVNEYLQTSHPDIYAAGDNAFFPCQGLGQSLRIEHWDNALNQGKWAGRNMAGAGQPFTYLPYFFSDLFEFGYEAVGEVDSRLEIFIDWQEENRKGVVYYLSEDRVRGIMACNLWDKMEQARELIHKGEVVKPEGLRGAIR